MINSISIGNILWGEIEDGRFSFRYKNLPHDIHFTFSWKNENNINLHLTRNIGDGKDKPKITIVKWDKAFADLYSPYIPSLFLNHQFKPASFSNYSRKIRKQIRILYFDELEQDRMIKEIMDSALQAIRKHTTLKRKKKMRLNPAFEKDIIPILSSKKTMLSFLNNLRTLNKNSFRSATSRFGIIFLGNCQHHFITYNNRCYILRKHQSLQQFLRTFMSPDFVDKLTKKIDEAICLLNSAKNYTDTHQHDSPYQLYLES